MRTPCLSLVLPLLAALGLSGAARTARAADEVKAKIPFAFTAGSSELSDGAYVVKVDWVERLVVLTSVESGRTTAMHFVTWLAKLPATAAAPARLVFDATPDGGRVLSEVWLSGRDGILVSATGEKHEHRTVDIDG